MREILRNQLWIGNAGDGRNPECLLAAGVVAVINLVLIAILLVGVELIARAVVVWNISRKARREIINGTYQPVGPRQRIGSLSSDVADKPPDPYRDAKYLLTAFRQKTMVSAALFEGCAFFAVIAYLIEGSPLSLGLAALLVLGVAAHFHTQSRAIAWVERQMETVEQEKFMR